MTFGQLNQLKKDTNPLEMTFGQSGFGQQNVGDGQHRQMFQPPEEKYEPNPFARQAHGELKELEKPAKLNRPSSKKHLGPVIAGNKNLPSVFKIKTGQQKSAKYYLI